MMGKFRDVKTIASVYLLMGVGISFYGLKKLKYKIRGKNGRPTKKDRDLPSDSKGINKQ